MAGLRDLAVRILLTGEDNTGPAIRSASSGLTTLETGVKNFETAARRILGITLFVGLAKQAIDLSDSYRTLQARLKLVTDGTEQFKAAQTELFDISQRTSSGLSNTYSVFVKLETAIKLLGGTQQQALATTETLNKAIALTSQGVMQDAAAILQFSQGLAAGVLRGENFNSVMEAAPGLAQALADGLDVPITKLRGMAEAGKLTSDVLVNALDKSAAKVEARFAVLPVTVSGAMTQVNNALLQYIGQSEIANSSTSKLSLILQTVAKNFDTVVSSVVTLAEIYAARLVVGLIASTRAFFDQAAAVKAAEIAQAQARVTAIASLETRAREAAANVLIKQQLVLEAAQRRELATSVTAETAAIAKLTAAQNAYNVAVTRAAAANTRLAATQTVVAETSGLMSRALGVVGSAVSGLFTAMIAYDIGKSLGDWLARFEWFRTATSNIAQALEIMQAAFSGLSFSERGAQMIEIQERYNQLRAEAVLSTQTANTAINVSETQKAEVIKAAELVQQQAFATTQAAVKALTATLDAETKTQTAALQQGLADRLAAINAADISDTAKEVQRVTAKIAAIKQTLALDQNAATQKLALIEQEYAAELQSAQTNAASLAGIETAKREDKLAVYRGIAEFYAGEVAKLSTLYGEETAAFAKSRDDLQSLEFNHKKSLLDIDRMSMDQHHKIESEQDEFDKNLRDIQAERKKGEGADQSKVNLLVENAKKLAADLTQEVVSGGVSQYDAKDNVNKLYAVEKQALTDNAAAHEKNAAAIKAALDVATGELAKANAQITEMTTALNQTYLLKVGIDQGSFDAAQAAIAELTKPETKVITIVTQNAGGGGEGGMAGGGWLPGFGGGDRIHALLEAGEFVVRKEAVKALGTPVLQNYINYGKLPAGDAIYRAMGGPVRKFADGGGTDDWGDVSRRKSQSYTTGWDAETKKYIAILQSAGAEGQKQLQDAYKSMKGIFYHDGIAGDKNIISAGKAEEAKSKQKTAKSTPTAPVMTAMPAVDLQQFADKAASASTQAPSSQLMQAPKKTVNVQFSAPGAEPVAGQFNDTDMEKLMQTLKSAGLRSNVV